MGKYLQGTHCTGKAGKMEKEKKSLSGKTQGIRKFWENTGNLVCSGYTLILEVKNISICHKNSKK